MTIVNRNGIILDMKTDRTQDSALRVISVLQDAGHIAVIAGVGVGKGYGAGLSDIPDEV